MENPVENKLISDFGDETTLITNQGPRITGLLTISLMTNNGG